jgi:hypothetical protein
VLALAALLVTPCSVRPITNWCTMRAMAAASTAFACAQAGPWWLPPPRLTGW